MTRFASSNHKTCLFLAQLYFVTVQNDIMQMLQVLCPSYDLCLVIGFTITITYTRLVNVYTW